MAPKLSSSQLSDFVLGKLSHEESLRVLDEIERDPEASRTVDYYASLLAFSQGEGKAMFEGRARPTVLRPGSRFPRAVRELSQSRWRYAVAAILFLGILLGIFARGKSIVWGEDAEYAALSDVEFGVGIRAEADDNLMVAMQLSNQGEHERAIRIIERLIRAEPSYPFPDYVNYSLGVVHLVAAKGVGWKSFRVYDREHARLAQVHLRRAVLLSASPRLKEESYWLAAKAHLMARERDSAIRCLEQVIMYHGQREVEARKLAILMEDDE